MSITTKLKNEVEAAYESLRIAKDNLAFATATKAEKRVLIAKDVLKWLETGRLKAEPGQYLNIVEQNEAEGIESCNACALGAVFACAVERPALSITLDDGLYAGSYSNNYDPDRMHEALKPYFSTTQLMMIENAFEQDSINNDEDGFAPRSVTARKVIDFNKGVSSPKERLARVMKNIIRNNGTFKP